MRLFVQIPCLNEAPTIAQVLGNVPRAIDGVGETSLVVIDDGSTDGTADIALANGADVLRHSKNQGHAKAVYDGISYCLEQGADAIVNMDGDGQHSGLDLPYLVQPIIAGRADVTWGARDLEDDYYSWLRRKIHRTGAFLLNVFNDTSVADPVCGYQVLNRQAAETLQSGRFTTAAIPMLEQLGRTGLRIVNVPVASIPASRPSKLMKGTITSTFRLARDAGLAAVAGGRGATNVARS